MDCIYYYSNPLFMSVSLLFSDDGDDIDVTGFINASYHILLLCHYIDSIDSNKKYIKI
jgi:hypothetical protein